jgi:Flp pilus assembly protein TadD
MGRLALAAALVRFGSFEASLEHIRVGTYFGPCDAVSLSNFGAAVYQARQVPHARRAWMKALYADPTLRASIVPLVRTEFELAVAACVRIPTPERTAVQTGVRDAALSWLRGDPETALDRFVKLSEEYPEDRFVWIYLAVAHMGLEQWPDSVRAFERAASGQPLEQAPGFLFAVALANDGRRSDALAVWHRIGMTYSFPPFP